MSLSARIPTHRATAEVSHTAGSMSKGVLHPAESRTAATVVGMSWMEAVLHTTSMQRLSEATPGVFVLAAISANVSANLLGLGNAATPLGIQAARRMAKKTPGVASDSLCMLVVCNTASIQLIPTTVAALRQAAGCAAPFDILPAVWLSSGISVAVGILAAKLFARVWPKPPKGQEVGR